MVILTLKNLKQCFLSPWTRLGTLILRFLRCPTLWDYPVPKITLSNLIFSNKLAFTVKCFQQAKLSYVFFSALPIIIWNWLEKPGQTKIYHPSRLVLLSCLVYKTYNVLFLSYSKAVSRCVIRLLRCTRYRAKTLYSEDSNPWPSCLINAEVLKLGDTYGLMATSQSSIYDVCSFYPQFDKNTNYTYILFKIIPAANGQTSDSLLIHYPHIL